MMINANHKRMVNDLVKDPREIDMSIGDRHVMHMGLGVAGEAGEVVDYLKKCIVNGRELDPQKVLDECGDVLFYMQGLLMNFDYDIEDAMNYNVRKLRKRYPEGYSDKASQERADENG